MILDKIAASPYATGIDLSKWNELFDIDTAVFKDVHDVLDFVMIRAGYGAADGTIHKDEKFDVYWGELLQHPETLRAVYWYFSSHSSWEAQRDKLFSIMENKDFDFWELDFEKRYNVQSAGFALTAIRFVKAMAREYPNKRVLIYSNKYDYRDWLRSETVECDLIPYHHAQYPWTSWDNITAYFLKWWDGVFTNRTYQPALPPSRGGSWDIWQVGANTDVGKLLGLGSEDVDVNVSKKKFNDFVMWVGWPKRWQKEPEPKPEPVTVDRNEVLNEAIAAIEGIKDA